ncbi:hypothetical protein QBC35DRAFT_151788 [Podospora australis]|uniref:Pre-mRNA-splicing factor 38B n=1 Tax=Podospora australis TaxID=1536484 RepID=A0AAN6WVK1_9PEZI|nr:hypothetical protein QBC35DRAFT_151788 [Podospora australis]
MASDPLLTDDLVAGLLTKEADEASIKYSSMGLEAFRSTKPANKAKPNTRFLHRIIQETTNHNDALRAKETAEAQARLDGLTEAGEKRRRRLNPTASDLRRRQLGAISSILHGGKRNDGGERMEGQRCNEDASSRTRQHEHRGKEKDGEDADGARSRRSRREEEDEPSPGNHHRRHRRRSDRSRSPAHQKRSSHQHRDRSPLSTDEDRHSHHRSKSHEKKPPKDRDARRRRDGGSSTHERYHRSGDHGSSKAKNSRDSRARHSRPHREEDNDADPLDHLIGPPPPPKSPVRVRGRGAWKGGAAMDQRFLQGCDFASDPQVDTGEGAGTRGDWDEAVELFRERQKWKQQGADRLRAAGFTEEQIRRWEKGGEKDVDHVRWTKRGEQREWDRGKGGGDDAHGQERKRHGGCG